MDVVLNLLQSLGVNASLFWMMGFFIFILFFLSYVVFGPYYSNYKIREARTLGKETEAFEMTEKSRVIEAKLKEKQTQLNKEINFIFEKAQKEGVEFYQNAFGKAKQESDSEIEETQRKLNQEYEELVKNSAPYIEQIKVTLLSKSQ